MRRSIAYPMYDLAIVAGLLLPLPLIISVANGRIIKAIGYAVARLGIWLFAALAAIISRVTPVQYLRSFRT